MEILLASSLTLTGVTAIAGAITYVKVRSDAQRLFLQNLALQEELSHQNERWHAVYEGAKRHAAAQQHDAVDSVQAEVDVLTIRLRKAEREVKRLTSERNTLEVNLNGLTQAVERLTRRLELQAIIKGPKGQWRRLRIDDFGPDAGSKRLAVSMVKPKPKA